MKGMEASTIIPRAVAVRWIQPLLAMLSIIVNDLLERRFDGDGYLGRYQK